MPRLDECRLPDGSTDWKKYNELQREELEARKAKGEVCQRKHCNRFIVWSRGFPQTCSDCKALDDPKELHHPGQIRCPKCGYCREIGDDYHLYGEGTHEVMCCECEFEFEVTTWVSYSFESPARQSDKDESADKDGTA